MFDLDMFYEDPEHSVIADRPNDFLFNDALHLILDNSSNFDIAAEYHWTTKMWQWFDSYRVWLANNQSGNMFQQPELSEVKAELAAHFRDTFKALRSKAVEDIKVEVDGMLFDGDELSRFRMATAILTASDDNETVQWHLANNVKASVTRVQLKEALRLSGKQMEAIWFQE